MGRTRLLWQLQATWAALVLVVVAAVALGITRRHEHDSRRELEDSLRAQALMLREIAQPALEGAQDAALQARLHALEEATSTRFTIVAADGRVVADSESDPSAMDNHLSRPEIRDALATGTGMSWRHSRSVQHEMLYVAVAMKGADGLTIGFARASLPTIEVAARVRALRAFVALGALAAAAAGILGGYLVARRVASPLASVTEAAESLADGRYRPADTSSDSEEVARFKSAFDRVATDLQSRMETIASERNRLVAILSSMVEGVIAVDRGQVVSHVNAAAAQILDLPAGDLAGRPAWELTRAPAVLSCIAETLERRAEVTAETRFTTHGRDLTLRLRCTPLLDPAGAVTGAVLVLHDVTELRRLEAVRRDFVANVSHELKTPLTAITGLVETILDDESMEAATRVRFLQRIADHSSRLATLVRDLLVLARVESAEEALQLAPLDLRDVAREAAARFATAAAGKGIALSAQLPDAEVSVSADDEALREVLDNLLDNAVKYTPPGGKVTLEVGSHAGIAEVVVHDTGLGIESTHLPRLFERFYRVDKARSRELGGTGLGLAIVKHFVQAHGGTASVESTPGLGSSFRVRLPLLPAGS